MPFNSIDFAIFLPVVFILYWFVTYKNLKVQNVFLIAASYFFYGWWDWRFLSLIAFSSFVDYFVGIGLSKTDDAQKRKFLLFTSIFVNLGFLGFFKYYNFFLENFVEAFSFFGQSINPQGINIILPVGISFYTFQTMSYSIDVYKRKLEPTKDIVACFAFVSFFPQLVAGPIERATNLLPQFYKKRTFEYDKAADGMRQILWGLFKKIVIADNCAKYVNMIFGNSADYSGSTLLIGAIFFAVQVYGDFSGYSDIAIGVSRLFGFNLRQNFSTPYFSQSIAEFWNRWHISLTSWLQDYLYTPILINMRHWGPTLATMFAVSVTWVLCGLWHGADWKFIVFGGLHALALILYTLTRRVRKNWFKWCPKPIFNNLSMCLTFGFVVLTMVVFRAESIGHAFEYFTGMFSRTLLNCPEVFPIKIVLIIFIFFFIEWLQRTKQHALQYTGIGIIRWAGYLGIVYTIVLFGGTSQEFIYFQF
jgi:alginate O-acetyltransferase complex protein AlgI